MCLAAEFMSKYGLNRTRNCRNTIIVIAQCANGSSKRTRDPLSLKHPDQSLSWRKFRACNITCIVNRLSAVA
jgi:hypothetical protein